MGIQEDLIRGAAFGFDKNGPKATRVFAVWDVEGEPHELNARAILMDGLPQFNDPHPVYPQARVTDINVKSIGEKSATKFIVTYTYSVPDIDGEEADEDEEQNPITVEVGATLQEFETEKDILGNRILVRYTPTNTDEDGGESPGEEIEQPATIRIRVPIVTARLTRTETKHPLEKSEKYTGAINSDDFLGSPPGTWMCTRLEGVSNDNFKTYQVVYEFEKNPDTFDAVVVYKDPDANNETPADIDLKPALAPLGPEYEEPRHAEYPGGWAKYRSARALPFAELKLGKASEE